MHSNNVSLSGVDLHYAAMACGVARHLNHEPEVLEALVGLGDLLNMIDRLPVSGMRLILSLPDGRNLLTRTEIRYIIIALEKFASSSPFHKTQRALDHFRAYETWRVQRAAESGV